MGDDTFAPCLFWIPGFVDLARTPRRRSSVVLPHPAGPSTSVVRRLISTGLAPFPRIAAAAAAAARGDVLRLFCALDDGSPVPVPVPVSDACQSSWLANVPEVSSRIAAGRQAGRRVSARSSCVLGVDGEWLDPFLGLADPSGSRVRPLVHNKISTCSTAIYHEEDVHNLVLQ